MSAKQTLRLLLILFFALVGLTILGLSRARLTFANAINCSSAYQINETLPNGSRWEMCWESRAREGIVFYDVYFTTAKGVRRKVLAQANVAQVHVPYDDNGVRFHDISDYGFGSFNMLNLSQYDCPTGDLIANGATNAMCKDVQSRGFVYKDADGAKLGHALKLFSVSTIGEYNYIPQWRFYDDGTIEPMMGATGNLQRISTDGTYGWPIRTGSIVGLNHLHNYYWRLDFDLDENGGNEIVEEIDFLPTNGNASRVISTTVLTTETARSIRPDLLRTWRIRDAAATNADGNAISYEIEALNMGSRDTGPAFEPFTQNDLYVTAYNPCELYVSHNPTTGGCGADVTTWLDGENINSADNVLYFGLSFHHIPRDEDEPNMHTHWSSFSLIPRDWSPRSDLADEPYAPSCTTQGVVYEWWEDVAGSDVSDLTQFTGFPNRPNGSLTLPSFVTPENQFDDAGVRIRSYLKPTVTGNYTFWLAADDVGELWLSDGTNAASKTLIASVATGVPNQEFDRHPSQQSVSVALQAGNYYYIEALLKEWGGTDHLSVAWQAPGGEREIITQQHLCAYEQLGRPPQAVISADSSTGQAPLNVTFNGANSWDADGDIVAYDWTFSDGSVATGAAPVHSFARAGEYTARLTVTDADGNVDSAETTISAVSAFTSCTTNGVLWEQWQSVYGQKISDLTSDPNYPLNPSQSGLIDYLEIPDNSANSYGVRLRAYIHPPETGDYTFWISSDDEGSLRLAHNDNPDHANEIARVNKWTPKRQWDWFPEQQSVQITLQEGNRYYIEALMKEAGGGDNLSIAWTRPSGERELIPSVALCPFEMVGSVPQSIVASTDSAESTLLPTTFLPATLSPLGQSVPDGFWDDMLRILTIDADLRLRVCQLIIQFESLVQQNAAIPPALIDEAAHIYTDLMALAAPAHQPWINSAWQALDIAQYTNEPAAEAWQSLNQLPIPTAVGLTADTPAANYHTPLLAVSMVLALGSAIYLLKRRPSD